MAHKSFLSYVFKTSNIMQTLFISILSNLWGKFCLITGPKLGCKCLCRVTLLKAKKQYFPLPSPGRTMWPAMQPQEGSVTPLISTIPTSPTFAEVKQKPMESQIMIHRPCLHFFQVATVLPWQCWRTGLHNTLKYISFGWDPDLLSYRLKQSNCLLRRLKLNLP